MLLLAGSALSQETTESSSSEDVAVTTVTSATTTVSTTEAPVVIVKQVNEINEDGTYTVGYEASDGSFKLETKDAEGNVKGKYGVVDENGEIKIVEYSANNSTGFTSDLELPEVQAVEVGAPVQQVKTFKIIMEMSSSFLFRLTLPLSWRSRGTRLCWPSRSPS